MADPSRLEALERRVQADPTSIAFAALAEEYRRAGRLDEAIATCRSGLERHPTYVSARVTLGRALLDAGHVDDARLELEQVLRVAPENLVAVRGLAEIHRKLGEIPEALEHLGRALALAPQDRELRQAVAELERAAMHVAPVAVAPPPDELSPILAEEEQDELLAPPEVQVANEPPYGAPLAATDVGANWPAPVEAFPVESVDHETAPNSPPEEPGDALGRQHQALEQFLAEIVRERARRAAG